MLSAVEDDEEQKVILTSVGAPEKPPPAPSLSIDALIPYLTKVNSKNPFVVLTYQDEDPKGVLRLDDVIAEGSYGTVYKVFMLAVRELTHIRDAM